METHRPAQRCVVRRPDSAEAGGDPGAVGLDVEPAVGVRLGYWVTSSMPALGRQHYFEDWVLIAVTRALQVWDEMFKYLQCHQNTKGCPSRLAVVLRLE